MKVKTITYTRGAETFTPKKYNSFTVGPFAMTLELEGEDTVVEATDYADEVLKDLADQDYSRRLPEFLAKIEAGQNASIDYDKEHFDQNNTQDFSGQQQQKKPADHQRKDQFPFAATLMDLVTAKQLGLIRGLARDKALDAEEECQKLFNCKTDELCKRAASQLIDHIKELPEWQNPQQPLLEAPQAELSAEGKKVEANLSTIPSDDDIPF